MPLLSEHDRLALQGQLAALTGPVTLLLFTQPGAAPEAAGVARQILDQLVALSDHVTVREVDVLVETGRAAAFGIAHVPAVALLRGEEDARIRFFGAPTGYEFVSLIQAIVLVGTGDSGLSGASRELLARHVTERMDIKVFSTPTCPQCPRAVALACRMAIESPHVTATCIEAIECLDLSREFRVSGVPMTVVDGGNEILGALPEDDFIRGIILPEGGSGSSDRL